MFETGATFTRQMSQDNSSFVQSIGVNWQFDQIITDTHK